MAVSYSAQGRRWPPDEARRVPSQRRHHGLAAVASIAVGVALGYIGMRVQVPGHSMVLRSAELTGAGVVLSLIVVVVASKRPWMRELWTFAVTVAVLSLMAGVFTFEFAGDVSLLLDSSATAQAQTALAAVQSGTRQSGLAGCSTLSSGSVGPLQAPYRVCAFLEPRSDSFVEFLAPTSASRGILYSEATTPTFLDGCSRHLEDQWWAFVIIGNGQSCPYGYSLSQVG